MTVTKEFQSVHLLKMTDGKMPVYHIDTFTKLFRIINKTGKGGNLESFRLLPLFCFRPICLSSRHDWNQFVMARYMYVGEPQEPS